MVRPQDRWVGGVAGGVARRLGIDPTLVRCLWVVVSVFTGIGLLAYGLGWALLPEESDGRIHVEEALAGRFEAGLAGAVGSVLVGMSLLDHGLLPGWYIGLWDVPGLGWTLWSLFWVALLALVLVGGIRYLSGQRAGKASQPPTGVGAPSPAASSGAARPVAPGDYLHPSGAPASAGAPSSVSATPPTGPSCAPGTWTAPGSAPSARPYPGPGYPGGMHQSYGGYHPSRTAPYPLGAGGVPHPPSAPVGHRAATPGPRPQRPGPGRGVSLTVLGLALICTAAIWFAASTERIGLLQSQMLLAGCVVGLLGAGVLVSGLRRRRGGWMTALGWPVLLVVLPGLVLGMLTPTSAMRATWPQILHGAGTRTVVTWEELSASAGGSSIVSRDLGIGRLILDLRDMPTDAGESLATISARVDVGNLSVLTREDQAVRIHARVDVGGVNVEMTGNWELNGSTVSTTDGEEGAGRYTTGGKRVAQSEYHVSGLEQEATVSSAAAADTEREAPIVTVDASTDIGSVNIIAGPEEVTWSGNAQEDVWIIYRWYPAGGSSPRTSLPVPGMDHPAVSSDTARECLASIQEQREDQDDWDDWDDYASWTDLSGLGDQQRAAYDDCLTRQLAAGAGSRSEEDGEDPAASPSPTTSDSPGTDPSPGDSASTQASDTASSAPSATATP
ncbi:PspC domain-containing protein [Actinomyces lilanjuaniae]|uniref:PspC domain-containing protein n=1 Tax=Actinomyces lilanjuaniae TaxID=2321394 RepID=A0ABN5PP15_9ACTO|nr:PspC domain-containing protein [Actinomyces lilanjuaniae]AYD90188.1 PspC domain-containing protein [Actinomyces lilanjuaniae]